MPSDATPSALDPFESLVEDYLRRLRRGEGPDPAEYAARYPEHAARIVELFPALALIEGLKPTSDDQTGPVDDSHPAAGASRHREGLETLGDYVILRELGRGGMGIVYEAEHESLKSRVALKVMHMRFRADRSYLRRFQTEARSAAKLHHTNIVPVFDYGEQNGVCYYAMQYIAGVGLDRVLEDVRRLRVPTGTDATVDLGAADLDGRTEALDGAVSAVALGLVSGRFARADSTEARTPATARLDALADGLTATADGSDGSASGPSEVDSEVGRSFAGRPESVYFREVARLGVQVADALEHAHRQGVVHRDIKPSNLLLDARGNVWVTDFGLAKLVEETDLSQSHDLAGTMRFMAPERFRGITDRRGDIYSLGATLYELLTLRPAFAAQDHASLLDRIAHEPPRPLREHDRRIPRDLETLVLKALAKDPADRFASAGELGEELNRFLESRPIRSRPIPAHERFWRWCKRNPWLAGANIAAATLTTLLAVASTIAAKVYYDGRERYAAVADDLRKSEVQAREKLFDARVAQARASRYSRRVGQRFESLAALREAVTIGRALGYPAERFDPLRNEAIASLMLPDLEPAGSPIPLPGVCAGVAFDDAMTRYALRRQDGTTVVHRLADGQEIARFTALSERDVWIFAFSPDGTYLASRQGNGIGVWDVERSSLVWTSPDTSHWSASFSPDSRRLAVPTGNTILVRDLEAGQTRHWTEPAEVLAVGFRPGGDELAVLNKGNPNTCRILDAQTGRERRAFGVGEGESIVWSHDGAMLAIGGVAGKIVLFSAARGERGATMDLPWIARGGLVFGFHPRGTLIATDGWDGRLRIWDAGSGRERLGTMIGATPTFYKDGRIISWVDQELHPLRVESAEEYATLRYASDRILNHARPSIHRDGRLLSMGTDHGVILWDLARRAEVGFLPIGLAWHSIFAPTGDLITNGGAGVLRWPVRVDPKGGELRIGPPRSLPLPGTDGGIAIDPTGRIIAVACHSDARVLLGDRTLRIGPLDDCRSVSISPDGNWLTTNNHQVGGVTIWSLPDGSRVTRLPLEGGATAEFSPDGKWLIAFQSSTRVWEVGTWREVRPIEGLVRTFTPDGRLALADDQASIFRLVELATGRIVARIERPDHQGAAWPAFSPDGSRLVMTTNDPPSTQVINLRAIRRGLAEIGLDWDAPAFSDDDPARADLPPLPPLLVDYGFMAGHLEHFADDPTALFARYTARIKQAPDDAEAYHRRAEALLGLNRAAEALDDLSHALRLRPDDVHLLHLRAQVHARGFQRLEPAIADLERALAIDPARAQLRELLANCCNNLAWELAAGPRRGTDLDRALTLSLRAVELMPGQQVSLNTRGVVLYRAGRYPEAVATLETSLGAGRGEHDGFDLVFLAMAHHRLGHKDDARRCLDRAIAWLGRATSLRDAQAKELAAFRAEAEAVLAGPAGELPDDVFARSGVGDRRSSP